MTQPASGIADALALFTAGRSKLAPPNYLGWLFDETPALIQTVGPMLPPLARPAQAPSPGPASHRRIDNLWRRREAIDGEQAEDRRRHGCHDHHHQFVVAHPRPAWFPTTLFVSSHDDLYFPVKHPA